jgi:hypothetical protein
MTEPIIRTFTVASWGTISSSTQPGNHVVNAIHECITRDDEKGHYWFLDTDSLSGTGIRNEDGIVTGLVLKNTYTNFDGNNKTQKLTLRATVATSSTVTRLSVGCALHPEGENTIINSLPTSNSIVKSVSSFVGALSSFSGEEPITGGYYNVANSNDCSLRYYNLTSIRIADGQTVTGWVIELPDAITIVMKTSASANWLYGIHAGKIFLPVDSSDYEYQFDGSGILSGSPSFINSSASEGHRWWLRGIGDSDSCAGNNVHTSKVRVGENTWKTPYIVNSGVQASASSNINGNPRLVPYEIRVGTTGRETTANIEGIIGTTKYLRKGAAGVLNDVVNSQNSSNNISWLRQHVSGANALMFHIWKRDVSPTTAQ